MSIQLNNQQFLQPGFTQGASVMPSSPVLTTSSLNTQQATLLPSKNLNWQNQGWQNQQWQDPLYNKQAGFNDDFAKRDALFHQGFQQNAALSGSTQVLEQTAGATTLDTVQTVQQPALQAGFNQSGTIALKPICIEQEAVSFRPGPITIEQPPLMIQPEAVTIPQPPIVIHPEPIVIPQAPLVFQPSAVALPRQAVTYQPDAITMARPSYTVQPIIQYDMRGCSDFGRADFKQHVHIKLTNEQLMRQGMPGGQWVQNSNMQAMPLGQQQLASTPSSPVNLDKPHAKFFSRDRDYNYPGNVPSGSDKLKDTFGVKNLGPQQNLAGQEANTLSRDRDYNYGNTPSVSDRTKDAFGVRNYGPEQPVVAPAV